MMRYTCPQCHATVVLYYTSTETVADCPVCAWVGRHPRVSSTPAPETDPTPAPEGDPCPDWTPAWLARQLDPAPVQLQADAWSTQDATPTGDLYTTPLPRYARDHRDITPEGWAYLARHRAELLDQEQGQGLDIRVLNLGLQFRPKVARTLAR